MRKGTHAVLKAILLGGAALAGSMPSPGGAAPQPAAPPVLQPDRPFEPQGRPLEGLVITLDAGYGGAGQATTPVGGARGPVTGLVDADLNLRTAALLRHHLSEAGAIVHLTRLDDRGLLPPGADDKAEAEARAQVATRTASHLLLSLHQNSAGRATAHGVVVAFWPKTLGGADQPIERTLAPMLRDIVRKEISGREELKLIEQQQRLISRTDVPAFILSYGFLSNADYEHWAATPGSHRKLARATFDALVAIWQGHRAELEEVRKQNFPEAPAPTPRPRASGDEGDRRGWKDTADRLWGHANPPATPEEFETVLRRYRDIVLSDRTSHYVRASVEETAEGGWKLTGVVNHPLLLKAVPEVLRATGVAKLNSQLELLPSERLGEQRFALTQIPMALTWREPREGASVETQLLLGEPLHLLDVTADGTYYLVHSGDSYVGWVRADAVLPVDREGFDAWLGTPKATLKEDVLLGDLRVPAGASLPVIDTAGDGTVTLRLPVGFKATKQQPRITVPRMDVRLPQEIRAGVAAADAAYAFLTVPYVFGGRSALGLDCSGLVGVCWQAAGVTLPRDANQQALVGRLVGTPWHRTALEPGDVLFFVDKTGYTIHTGISLGGSRFIHASPPEVQVNSFDPTDPLYSATWTAAFSFARRPAE